jgi:2-haloacid dehalogenase
VRRVLAFDVNETLLDLRALDPLFEQQLGSAALRQAWFSQMLQLAFVGGLTGRYVDFASAGQAALAMVAAAEGVALEEGAAGLITGELRRLPPHPDAEPALTRLRESGFTLAALTNSTLEVAREQLEHAGLAGRFHAILSADQVRALKPRPEPYHLVADHFGVPHGGVRLIAAHSWDVAGALAAGCAAAFVRRPGKVPSPLGDQPDIVGDDLGEVAAAILAVDGDPR